MLWEATRIKIFIEYLALIDNLDHRAKMEGILEWVHKQFPSLLPKLAWNQPMFTDHGTFIIGFSAAKNHMSIAPERKCIERFSEEILNTGFDQSKELIRVKWNQEMDYNFLGKIVLFNITDKAGCTTFWRK